MPPDQYLELERARLRYRDEGLGPAILLIHGWALDLEVWEPQVSALGGRYRLLRFDRRGYGLSTGAPSLRRDERDAIALLDQLGVRRAALVGASQGARVALRVALAAPERVACLVLDAPPDEVGSGRGALTDEVPLDHYRQLARSGDMRRVRRLWSQHPFTQLASRDPAARALLAAALARYAGNDLLLGNQPPSALGDLRRLKVPALVLNGERDLASRRASGAELARALPGATHRLIPDAGHLANLDNPDAYGDALHEFVNAAFRASSHGVEAG
jgi:pimeloyl-ACP methyl ester carboxylesterase